MTKAQANLLGNLVKSLRHKAGLSLYGLAEESGVERSTLLRIERGESTEPTRATLNGLARVFGVDAEIFYEAVWRETSAALPAYFRSKYGLTHQQAADIQARVRRRQAADRRKARNAKSSTKERRSP